MFNLKITWWNDCDGENYFQNGYKNEVYFEACWDSPVPTVTEEIKFDGNLNPTIKTSRVSNKCVFEVLDIFDAQIFALTCIRNHDHITITDMISEQELEVIDFTFTPSQQNDCFQKGRFVFEVGKCLRSGCCKNGTIVPCPI